MSSTRGYTKTVNPTVINNHEVKKEILHTGNATRVLSVQYPAPHLVDIYV